MDLAELWARATATQPLPSAPVVALTAAVALALVLLPGVWPVARHAVTVVHEAGHALVAVLTGRRLTGIRLHSDTSGLTVSRGRPRGPGMVLTLAAGYPAPALLGLGSAALLSAGHAVGLLWALLVVLALMLVQIRNLFGLWVVVVGILGVLAVTWWAPPTTQTAVALTLTWFWLLAAPRTVLEVGVSRRRDRSRTSDPDQLSRLTRVPAVVWVGLMLLVTLGAAALGAAWLLPDVLGPDGWTTG